MTAEQAKLYESEKSKARNFLLDNYQAGNGQYQMVVHQTLMRLRQLVNHPRMILDDYRQGSGKFQDVLEEWDVIRRSGHKVLMFSSFVSYLDLFKQALQEAGLPLAWLSGDLSSTQRQAEIARFQNDPQVQAFLISIKAGGTGLNLTAADYVFVLDPWWNPFVEQQAIARAHRIGQDKNVIALKFITRGSIEEKILVLQDRKKQLAEDIIAHTEKLSLQRDELAFLLE
ncbi:MAG TPA: C-terminal helicase domain-containing protein, partial [Saprospiraceae bacterium]|nr:C-terminal helicase domain-containing protein [Saprospiraceae bacterium]